MKITYLRWCDDISFFFSKFSIKEAIQRSESNELDNFTTIENIREGGI